MMFFNQRYIAITRSTIYTYDDYGRIARETRTMDGETPVVFSYVYNSHGNLKAVSYPGDVQTVNHYDVYGNLEKVTVGEQTVWEHTGYTGTVSTTVLGGSMTATETYNQSGNLTGLSTVKGATSIRDMDFVFNPATGNLSSRTGMIGQQETFTYDNLDRLTGVLHGSQVTPGMSIGYAANGNILNKTGLGQYSYYGTKVTEIENTAGLLNTRGQEIEYNASKRAYVLKDTVGTDAYRLDIYYGYDGQRWKTVLQKNGSVSKTTIFAGDYEKITEDGITKELIYLPGGGIHVKQTGQPDRIYYMHTDHLGSILKLTDGNGTPVFEASYDAWGKRTVTNNTFRIADLGCVHYERL